MDIIDTCKCYSSQRRFLVDPAGFVPTRHFYCDYGILTSMDWTRPNNEWLYDEVGQWGTTDDDSLDIPYLLAGLDINEVFGVINVQIPGKRKKVEVDGELATTLYLREKRVYLNSNYADRVIEGIEDVPPPKDDFATKEGNRKKRYTIWHQLLNLNRDLNKLLKKAQNSETNLKETEIPQFRKYKKADEKRIRKWNIKQSKLLQEIAFEIPTQREVSTVVGSYLQRLTESWGLETKTDQEDSGACQRSS